jgi:integrase/recombinase XerD
MTALALATGEQPSPFEAAVAVFLEHLAVRNYAAGSVAGYGHALSILGRFLAEAGVVDPATVTAEVLDRYRHHLARSASARGLPLAVATQSARLQAARVFFRWLWRTGRIPHNPAEGLDPPLAEHRLPPATLTVTEIETILALPDTTTVFGLRDRAMLEVLYSTAIRRAELAALRLEHLDPERRTVFVAQGKGHKDRYVPIGERALHWIGRYLADARPHLALPPPRDDGTLFLGYTGRKLSRDYLSQLVTGYIDASGIPKHGSCHLIRHSTATLMLEGGADIRHIAELLGHARMETTQRYTRVSIHQLRAVHTATHPGANLPHPPA